MLNLKQKLKFKNYVLHFNYTRYLHIPQSNKFCYKRRKYLSVPINTKTCYKLVVKMFKVYSLLVHPTYANGRGKLGPSDQTSFSVS